MAAKPKKKKSIDFIEESYASARRMIEVPEWQEDGKPMQLWFPPLTSADMGKVSDIEAKDRFHENCYLIVLMAEYEDGRKRFSIGDNLVLRNRADFIVIQRVVNFLYSTHVMTTREADEAVTENPTSVSASA
jgi:hypothetical protein